MAKLFLPFLAGVFVLAAAKPVEIKEDHAITRNGQIHHIFIPFNPSAYENSVTDRIAVEAYYDSRHGPLNRQSHHQANEGRHSKIAERSKGFSQGYLRELSRDSCGHNHFQSVTDIHHLKKREIQDSEDHEADHQTPHSLEDTPLTFGEEHSRVDESHHSDDHLHAKYRSRSENALRQPLKMPPDSKFPEYWKPTSPPSRHPHPTVPARIIHQSSNGHSFHSSNTVQHSKPSHSTKGHPDSIHFPNPNHSAHSVHEENSSHGAHDSKHSNPTHVVHHETHSNTAHTDDVLHHSSNDHSTHSPHHSNNGNSVHPSNTSHQSKNEHNSRPTQHQHNAKTGSSSQISNTEFSQPDSLFVPSIKVLHPVRHDHPDGSTFTDSTINFNHSDQSKQDSLSNIHHPHRVDPPRRPLPPKHHDHSEHSNQPKHPDHFKRPNRPEYPIHTNHHVNRPNQPKNDYENCDYRPDRRNRPHPTNHPYHPNHPDNSNIPDFLNNHCQICSPKHLSHPDHLNRPNVPNNPGQSDNSKYTIYGPSNLQAFPAISDSFHHLLNSHNPSRPGNQNNIDISSQTVNPAFSDNSASSADVSSFSNGDPCKSSGLPSPHPHEIKFFHPDPNTPPRAPKPPPRPSPPLQPIAPAPPERPCLPEETKLPENPFKFNPSYLPCCPLPPLPPSIPGRPFYADRLTIPSLPVRSQTYQSSEHGFDFRNVTNKGIPFISTLRQDPLRKNPVPTNHKGFLGCLVEPIPPSMPIGPFPPLLKSPFQLPTMPKPPSLQPYIHVPNLQRSLEFSKDPDAINDDSCR